EVYRQQVVSPEPPFERIARLGSGVNSYADEAVETGATYRYYVVAFDTSFNRSDPSNEIGGTAESRFVAVTFRVRVPDYTPGTVYLVGDIPALGPWNPGLVPMTMVEEDIWEYTLDILDGTNLQYKYTRGSWDTVESWGSIVNVNNRHVLIEYGDDGAMLVDNTGTAWDDGNDDVDAVQYWRDPLVVEVYPEPGATDVPVEGTTISVTWSIPMAPGSNFEVTGPNGDPVDGTFSYDETTLTTVFTPAGPLAPASIYTVTVEGQISVGVPNGDSGVQQVPYTWTFTTEGARSVAVTFRVGVPDYTPGAVYIVGDIPALGSGDPGAVPMTEAGGDVWEFTVEIPEGTQVAYKYTRGSWETVESWGSIVGDAYRTITVDYGDDGTMLVDNTGTDWDDADDNADAVRYWRDPLVVDVYPEPGATQVPIRGTVISVTWSIPMAPGTSFEVRNPLGRVVAGTFTYDADTMTTLFTPARPLAPVGVHTVTVSDQVSVGVPGGESGVQQVPFMWSFNTHPARTFLPVNFVN